jgi:hypothetical protein
MRDCARSLRVPASTILIDALNRVHERLVEQITAHPEVLAIIVDPHAEACAAGIPRWDGEAQACLSEIIAAVRAAGRSLPPVH